jgi:tRNA dimethylallyltransferase
MKKVIILLGPTCVGKTAVSILLAKMLNTEIISSDSMQIYRHMDIGTAKPSQQERQTVKHHMIDIVEPWESYSTGEYIKNVQPIISGLHKDGKVPVIVGGTGLYIRAMTRGIFKGPSADWDLRTELLKKEEKEPGFLYNHLKALDLKAAEKIMPNDLRRIVRALEVCLKSMKTMSELHEALTAPLPYDYVKIGLMRDRKELYRMIEERVDGMIRKGLVREVGFVINLIKEHFLNSGPQPLNSELSSMQAIGYKEIAKYLSGEVSIEEAIRLVKKRSKVYAKRQFTWFKKEDGIQWIDITGMNDPYDIFQKVIKFIHV